MGMSSYPPIVAGATAAVATYKGPWSATGSYIIGDTVVYQGALWRATAASSAQSTFPSASFASDLASAPTATGQYTGDSTNTRTITIGFTPKFVVLWEPNNTNMWLMMPSGTSLMTGANTGATSQPGITGSGFVVSAASTQGNASGRSYYWSAFG